MVPILPISPNSLCENPQTFKRRLVTHLVMGGPCVHRSPLVQLVCSKSHSGSRPKGLAQRFYKSSKKHFLKTEERPM